MAAATGISTKKNYAPRQEARELVAQSLTQNLFPIMIILPRTLPGRRSVWMRFRWLRPLDADLPTG
jgi:hypothetical protein